MPCGAEDEASTDDGLWESPQNQRSRVSSIYTPPPINRTVVAGTPLIRTPDIRTP